MILRSGRLGNRGHYVIESVVLSGGVHSNTWQATRSFHADAQWLYAWSYDALRPTASCSPGASQPPPPSTGQRRSYALTNMGDRGKPYAEVPGTGSIMLSFWSNTNRPGSAPVNWCQCSQNASTSRVWVALEMSALANTRLWVLASCNPLDESRR